MPPLTTLIELAVFPPLGLLQPVLDTSGPYATGDHTLVTWTTSGFGIRPAGTYSVWSTYGVVVVPNGAIPSTWGYSIGWDSGGALGNEGNRYYERFAQLVPQHELITGFWISLDHYDVHYVPDFILWPFRIGGGDRLGLHVEPAISVDLYFLALV